MGGAAVCRRRDTLEEAHRASPRYEVELEFCGQHKVRAKHGRRDSVARETERLASSMFFKVRDLVDRVMA